MRKRRYQQATEAFEGAFDAGTALLPDARLAASLAAARGAAPELDLTHEWAAATRGVLTRGEPGALSYARSPSEWAAIFERYPTEGGAPRSFGVADIEGVRGALSRYGVVVVDVFGAAEVDATVSGMFDEINAASHRAGRAGGINPEHPATWGDEHWPSDKRFLLSEPAWHPAAFATRCHEGLYRLFAGLWNEPRLQVSIDKWGVTRGTRDIPEEVGGEVVLRDRPRWGRPLTLHWDCNPWLFSDERAEGRAHGWQGLLALNDHDEENGCHLTLPRGEAFLERWCAERVCPEGLGRKRRSHRPRKVDPIREHMQRLTLKRGQMVLWSWGQLHGNTANRSRRMRLMQFIRMFPAPEADPYYATHDRYAASRVRRLDPRMMSFSGAESTLSDLGRRLVGLDPW